MRHFKDKYGIDNSIFTYQYTKQTKTRHTLTQKCVQELYFTMTNTAAVTLNSLVFHNHVLKNW